MNRLGTWAWRRSVLVAFALTLVTATAVLVAGKLHGWNLRGVAESSDSTEPDGDLAIEAMLTEAEAARVLDRVKQMMNPTEATEAAAQIRDHLEDLARHQAATAAPSMALFLETLAPRYESLDSQSRQISLALMSDIFGWFGQNVTPCWPALLSPAKNVLCSAMSDASSDVVVSAIQFVTACWEWSPPNVVDPAKRKALGTWKADLHNRCVELMRSDEDRIRAAAGVAVVCVPLESAAVRGLVLLQDQSPAVRRAMLLSLSDRPELLSSEDVVGFLRDPSATVRNGANLVLTSRGLTPEQVALAQRATDPSPKVRAQAPRHIVESTAVDRVVWLTQLSRDSVATVRSEAARALASVDDEECRNRLREMAESDPDHDVRRLADELFRAVSLASQDSDSGEPPSETLPTLRTPKAN